MNIKYLGHSSFKIQGATYSTDETSVVIDPFNPKNVGLPFPATTADIIASTHEGHGDHGWYEGVTGNPFIVNTPGEYEIKGLSIEGLKSYHDDTEGKERGLNTVYNFDFKEANVTHLGDIGHIPDAKLIEAIEGTEILIIPIGGTYTIDGKKALEIIEMIEPLIVIPMHYKTDKHSSNFDKLETLENFIKNNGITPTYSKEIKIKSKADLPTELTFIILES